MANILFIFEGEKTEKQIADNLTKYFINENIVVQCAYCANIYRLYKELEEDEYLDVFLLLKELNKEILSTYKRSDFAEIYMFFDYDGHDTVADDNKVLELLNFFDEETLNGKLFINYPMVESLKHYNDTIDFKNLKVKAKENIRYKQLVNNDAKNDLKQITQYSKNIWILLLEIHLMKMNYIVNDDYSLPKNSISQIKIFINQFKKFINKDSTVAVLNSFPIFLFDYYGSTFIVKLLSK